jgi:hypothetical protein
LNDVGRVALRDGTSVPVTASTSWSTNRGSSGAPDIIPGPKTVGKGRKEIRAMRIGIIGVGNIGGIGFLYTKYQRSGKR